MNDTYRVLVAEDEELQLNSLVKKIGGAPYGFRVVGTAQTGAAAMELVDTLRPDVVFTDIRMPVKSGLELLSHIYAAHPYTRTVIISGYSDFAYAKKAISCHVFEYLLKPVTTEDLQGVLLKLSAAIAKERGQETGKLLAALQGSTQKQKLEYLQQYLHANFDRQIDMNRLASELGYNASYLNRIYEQEFHSTPNRYIQSLRIDKAKYLLSRHPGLSVRQVGEMVGYPDQAYFSRVFKKQTGQSPNEFKSFENT